MSYPKCSLVEVVARGICDRFVCAKLTYHLFIVKNKYGVSGSTNLGASDG